MRNGRLRSAIARLMAGRYGFDQYSRFLCLVGCGCLVISLFTKKVGSGYVSLIFTWAALVMLIWCYWRTLSRKIQQRQAENIRYLNLKSRFVGWFGFQKDKFQQRKDYSFYRCPGCRAAIRVPRGKGRIRITCRRCGYAFERKT